MNHAGNTPENPVAEGFKVRIRLTKHRSSSLRKCWVNSGGQGAPAFADLASRCVREDESVYVDVVAGIDLEAGDEPVENVIHFTLDNDTHASVALYVITGPDTRVTLDGYDARNPVYPLVYPVYVEEEE